MADQFTASEYRVHRRSTEPSQANMSRSMFGAAADHDPDAAGGSKIPVVSSRQPKKGILKRASSMRDPNREARDTLSPTLTEPGVSHGYTPPREPVPADPTTRIPKLQVHFPESASESDDPPPTVPATAAETSETADQAPSVSSLTAEDLPTVPSEHDGSPSRDSEFDDASSVASSASNIVGVWWHGKQTKYVPHCERRHLKGQDAAEYLTPTQRRNKEATDLKKRLHTSEKMLLDKEKHLSQLRERLTELESILENSGSVMQNYQLLQKNKELELEIETLEAEKIALVAKHEQEVLAKEEARLKSLVHKAVMTIDFGPTTADMGTDNPEEDVKLANEFELLKVQEHLEQVKLENSRLKLRHSEMQEELATKKAETSTTIIPDTTSMSNQMLAYHNEAVAWRTKASELELAYKALQDQIINDMTIPKERRISVRETAKNIRKQSAAALAAKEQGGNVSPAFDLVDSGFDESECRNEHCKLKKKTLEDENDEMMNEISALENKLKQAQLLSDDLEQTLQESRSEAEKYFDQAKAYEREIEMNQAKVDAAALSVARLQQENVELYSKAEAQVDEIDQLKNHMIDAGVFVGRKTLTVDKDYIVSHSIRSQTDLTSQCISTNDNEFSTLTDRISKLEAKHRRETSGFSETLHEVQESLQVKSELVKTLTRQLEQINDNYEKTCEQMNKERQQFSFKLEEITAVAEKVPVLEFELSATQEQLREAEVLVNDQKEDYNEVIENSIKDNMKAQLETMEYWKQRVWKLESALEATQKEVKQSEKQRSDAIMRMKLEKVELEQKLQESLAEIQQLHSVLYKPRENRGIMAVVEMVDNKVQAIADVADAGTMLLKGDLYDEVEERLKLTTGELHTTRRQVEIIQEKFQEKMAEVSDTKENLEELTVLRNEMEKDIQEAQEEMHTMRMKYEHSIENLEKHCKRLEDEKVGMQIAERERMKQIEMEFDNMQTELDDVIKKYEAEKRRLKDRVRDLENANDGLRAETKAMIETNALGQILSSSTNIDLMELDLLEQRLESLQGSEAGTGLKPHHVDGQVPSGSQSAGPSPRLRRKNTPGIKFLLDRLQTERTRYTEENETLERQVRDLNAELEMARSNMTSSTRMGKIYRSVSYPYVDTLPQYSQAESNGDSAVVANLRVKNLVLMKENQKLLTDLCSTRGAVAYVLEKQENIQTKAEQTIASPMPISDEEDQDEVIVAGTESEPATGAFVNAMLKERRRKRKERQIILSDNETEEEEITLQRTPKPQSPSPQPSLVASPNEDLADELNEVRIDLQGILSQIDSATSASGKQTATSVRENRLMMWLEKELEEEKHELDALNKWYEADKQRLQTENATIKSDRTRLQAEVDQLSFDFHDVSRELELYKMEDAQALGESKAAELTRYRSFTDLACVKSAQSNWKSKFGNLYREFLAIQRDFELVDRQRRNFKQELDMIAGEIIILRAEREIELEKGLAGQDGSLLSKVHYRQKLKEKYEEHINSLKQELESTQLEKQKCQKNQQAAESRARELDQEVTQQRIRCRELEFDQENMKARNEKLTLDNDVLQKENSDQAAKILNLVEEQKPERIAERKIEAQIRAIDENVGGFYGPSHEKELSTPVEETEINVINKLEETEQNTGEVIVETVKEVEKRGEALKCEVSVEAADDAGGSTIDGVVHTTAGSSVANVQAVTPSLPIIIVKDSKSEIIAHDDIVGSPEEELERLVDHIDFDIMPTFDGKSEEELEEIVHQMEEEIAELKKSRVCSPVERPFSAPLSGIIKESFKNFEGTNVQHGNSGELELRIAQAVMERDRELGDQHRATLDIVNERNRQQMVRKERELRCDFQARKKEKESEIEALKARIAELETHIDRISAQAAAMQTAIVFNASSANGDTDPSQQLDPKDVVIRNMEERIMELESKAMTSSAITLTPDADEKNEEISQLLQRNKALEDELNKATEQLLSAVDDSSMDTVSRTSETVQSPVKADKQMDELQTRVKQLEDMLRDERAKNEQLERRKSKSRSRTDDASRYEDARSRVVAQLSVAEERVWKAEKEMAMMTRELEVVRGNYEKKIQTLETERNELQEKLHHMVLVAEKVRPPFELEDALDTNRELQKEVDKLQEQLDAKENEHREMYLTMFKKGQETARAELATSRAWQMTGDDKSKRSRSESISSNNAWQISRFDDAIPVECETDSESHVTAYSAVYSAGEVEKRAKADGLTDDQVVLRFLRDATYYFLMNTKNNKDHLTAIMSLLKFDERQRREVQHARKGQK